MSACYKTHKIQGHLFNQSFLWLWEPVSAWRRYRCRHPGYHHCRSADYHRLLSLLPLCSPVFRTGLPASACLRMAMFWLSEKRDVFM